LRANSAIPEPVITIAEQHHEKLASAQLNELPRMAAIVEVLSALTDRRPYKPPMAAEKALAVMCGPGSGPCCSTQWSERTGEPARLRPGRSVEGARRAAQLNIKLLSADG